MKRVILLLLGLTTTLFLDAQVVTDTSSYDSLSPHFPTDTLGRRPIDISTPDSVILTKAEEYIWMLKGDSNVENCDFERGQLLLLDSAFYYYGKSFRLQQMARSYEEMALFYKSNISSAKTSRDIDVINTSVNTYRRVEGILLEGAMVALEKGQWFFGQIDRGGVKRSISSIL